MTRKDYIKIAAAIRGVDDTLTGVNATTNVVMFIVDALYDVLTLDNPKFNVSTFRKAALHQPESEPVYAVEGWEEF